MDNDLEHGTSGGMRRTNTVYGMQFNSEEEEEEEEEEQWGVTDNPALPLRRVVPAPSLEEVAAPEQILHSGVDYHDFYEELGELENNSALAAEGPVIERDGSTKPRIPPTEALIGTLLLKNVIYTRSIVLKHRVIVRSGTSGGDLKDKYKPMCTPSRLQQIRDDLAHYTTALQNYRYRIDTCMDSSIREVTGFPGQGEDLAVLECAELHKKWDQKELLAAQYKIVTEYAGDPTVSDLGAMGTFLHTNNFIDGLISKMKEAADEKKILFFSRLSMALFGGFALIVPMLIMTLHPTKLTTLLTTSLFVVAVAVALAWWMEDAQNKDIIAATAAYAAVLVVFVGSGTSNTT